MKYNEAIAYLYSRLPMFHRVGAAAYKADLNNTITLCSLLGNPENYLSGRSIHIAGTNGKGSTSHMLAAVLQTAGYKTGLYTSPHLLDFRERIRIDGEMIPEQEVISFIEKYQNDFEEINPSFFEWTVALAFNYFESEKVDVAVIETGLGGRLDSTNVITPLLSVITNIGLDHLNLLGDTLEKITIEKAGIIKKNVPVVIGETQSEIKNVFIDRANEMNAPVLFAAENYDAAKNNSSGSENFSIDILKENNILYKNLKLDLTGNYQLKNIVTVVAALEEIKRKFPVREDVLRNGLKDVKKITGLRGRWEILLHSPLVICDVGHNAEGIAYIVEQIKNTKHNKLHFVFGVVNDKSIDTILKLLPRNAEYYFCHADIPRALDSAELTKQAKAAGLKGNDYFSVKEAVNAAIKNSSENDFVFIGGSTFVVAEAIPLFEK